MNKASLITLDQRISAITWSGDFCWANKEYRYGRGIAQTIYQCYGRSALLGMDNWRIERMSTPAALGYRSFCAVIEKYRGEA